MVEITPRKIVVHTAEEYGDFERSVGKLTYGRIQADGTPRSRQALLKAVEKHDQSMKATPKTNSVLFKWISENLWERPAEPEPKLKLPKGYRTYTTKKGVMVRGKHYKHAITLAMYAARVRGGKASAAKRKEAKNEP